MTGDNNVCPSCGARFRSSRGFDAHRTGEFGISRLDGRYTAAQRRCKSSGEMTHAGMLLNGRGLWITEAFKMPPQ